MNRDLMDYLLKWKNSPMRMPLIMRGARQVGKTYLIETLGRTYYSNLVVVNFEKRPTMGEAFETLHPPAILAQLELLTGQAISPATTLLFLDEIQLSPQAITALRYFKEEAPELHVIAAGSLLEFALPTTLIKAPTKERLKVPVGRVEFCHLFPLSFAEFLSALGEEVLRAHLEEVTLDHPPPSSVHKRLLTFTRLYAAIGGMPAAIEAYRRSQSFLEVQKIHDGLLIAYRADFGLYAAHKNYPALHQILNQVPSLLGQWVKYTKIDPDRSSREIKQSIALLTLAGLLHRVEATSATGIPLAATGAAIAKQKKFKLFFLDLALANRMGRLDLQQILKEETLLINRGALAEQWVAQELIATLSTPSSPTTVYSWYRDHPGSTAEVDFVIEHQTNPLPIEVKAGTTGRLKSLLLFMQEKKVPLGLRISSRPLSWEAKKDLPSQKGGVLSVPFYLTGQIHRLAQEVSSP